MLVMTCLGGCTSSRTVRMLDASMDDNLNDSQHIDPGTVVDIVLIDGSEYSGEMVDYTRDEVRIRYVPSNYHQEVMTRPRTNLPNYEEGVLTIARNRIESIEVRSFDWVKTTFLTAGMVAGLYLVVAISIGKALADSGMR